MQSSLFAGIPASRHFWNGYISDGYLASLYFSNGCLVALQVCTFGIATFTDTTNNKTRCTGMHRVLSVECMASDLFWYNQFVAFAVYIDKFYVWVVLQELAQLGDVYIH